MVKKLTKIEKSKDDPINILIIRVFLSAIDSVQGRIPESELRFIWFG
jgi:hypothetical protein